MQPTFNNNSRQRPLQKSMFLPSTEQFQHRNNSLQYQYQEMMKRSSINPDTNLPHNYHNNINNNNFNISPPNNFQQINQNNPQTPILHNNSQTPISQYTVNSNSILNFNSTPRHKQNKYLQLDLTSPSQDHLIIQQMHEKIEKLTSIVQIHEDILKKNNLSNTKQQSQKLFLDTQIQLIQSKLKESVIPSLINKQTKQIYQHIFNFKIQINGLKQQISSMNDKYKNQMLNLLEKSTNLKSSSTNSSNHSSDKIQQLSGPQINSNIFSLQKKLQQIQKNILQKDQQIKSLIQIQIQKNRNDLQFSRLSPRLKQSTIQSTLPPMMLEYQQLFVIKNTQSPRSLVNKIVMPNQKNKDQTQILINSCIYYIDKQGFLLDSQNRYIVDPKGLQIKLDEKHLALLKQHHVLT